MLQRNYLFCFVQMQALKITLIRKLVLKAKLFSRTDFHYIESKISVCKHVISNSLQVNTVHNLVCVGISLVINHIQRSNDKLPYQQESRYFFSYFYRVEQPILMQLIMACGIKVI